MIVPVVMMLAGCGGSRTDAATHTVLAFARATAAKQGGAACALLSPAVADAVAQDAGTSCAAAVLRDGLPRPARIVRAQVFGHQAYVVTADDSVFLSQFPQGWKVIAAGCTPRGEKPYDCLVSGGG